MIDTPLRFTAEDWPDVIVPMLEDMLGERAAAVIQSVERYPTTGLRVRALIAQGRHDALLLRSLHHALAAVERSRK